MIAPGDIQRVGVLIILHVAEVVCIHAQAESAGDGEGPVGGHAGGREGDARLAAEVGPVFGRRGDQRAANEGIARKRKVKSVDHAWAENMGIVQSGVMSDPVVGGIEGGRSNTPYLSG